MVEAEEELVEITDFAVGLARRAGERIMPNYRSVVAETKSDGNMPALGETVYARAGRRLLVPARGISAGARPLPGPRRAEPGLRVGLGGSRQRGRSGGTRSGLSTGAAGERGPAFSDRGRLCPARAGLPGPGPRGSRFADGAVDSAALVPCVREAGGAVAAIDGARNDVVFSGSLVSAANEALLAEVVSCIRPES